MMKLNTVLAPALILSCAFLQASSTANSGVDLYAGYRAMYAISILPPRIQKFTAWKRVNPNDPMGPVSNAAAYLFSELERLHVLDTELFVSDDKFQQRQHLTADPALKRAIEDELASGRQFAQRVLASSPNDQNALLASVMSHGLEADYLSLIEHHDLAALSVVKEGRALAGARLANDHPDCYDAYLAIGVENYLLSLKPAPVRWMLSWSGAQTNREVGIAKLRLTAEKGFLLQPYARMLLAVAALRDNDRGTASRMLEGLARDFPHNRLYAAELSRIKDAK